MEQLIEALRKAEAEVAGKYFPGESQAVTKYETYTQAVQVASELPGLPAGVLGPYSLEQNAATETVSDFHKEGAAMQKAYEEAGERYETLMTAPRSDLGDSIRKAFSNVDDILTDMSLEKHRKISGLSGFWHITVWKLHRKISRRSRKLTDRSVQ